MLKTLTQLPKNFFELKINNILSCFNQPTLIKLTGTRPEPLFISTLLHGNEHTGFYALQSLLQKYQDKKLPRSLYLFFANPHASAQNLRSLKGTPDYNRIWNHHASPEGEMVRQITELMKQENLFASIDIHNNTGKNPLYGCVSSLQDTHLQLASLFSRTVVYYQQPSTTQSVAFSSFCPAITIECGKSGEPTGVDKTIEFIEACLHLSQIPNHAVAAHDIDIYETFARLRVPNKYSFSFGTGKGDIDFRKDLEYLNFSDLEPGTAIAKTQLKIQPIIVEEPDGEVLDENYLSLVGNQIITTKNTTPSMLTNDIKVIQEDCLGYLMRRKCTPTP